MFFKRKEKKQVLTSLDVKSPLTGAVVALSEVPDEAFSGGAMGQGFAVEPEVGRLVAPFSGTVVHVMEKSKHAVMLEHDCGVQILMHIGMNTVSLKGEGFKLHIETGQRVEEGQLLIEFDMALIRQAGLPLITPVIVPIGQECVKRVEVVGEKSDCYIRVHL
ncbi:PTS glucose transporter subunit IIA [Paenibacillus sp. M1]|uniref:PTS glucose transporter subunit IIA n=1 Tax=Paenibacillus haidiansis TaxID=1574488 RepID=A0ABU7VY31_9BACL